MKSFFNKRIIPINEFLLPFLVVIAFLFSILETITYLGYISKFLLVDSRFFLILALLSVAIYSQSKLRDSKLHKVLMKLNLIAVPVLVLIYFVLQFLEVTHFRNYVFSTYHIQPTNFLYVVFLNLSIAAIYYFLKSSVNLKRINLLSLIAFVIVFSCTFNGFIKTFDSAIYSNLYLFSHLNISYDDKMKERWGIYYSYMKFVETIVPKDSSILVPPQELPWYSTGNVGLDRYFLFPRILENGTYEGKDNFSNYDYIMLVWGEWEDDRKERYGWPKVNVKAEEVIYFNDSNNEVMRIKGNFIPKESIKYGVWGLIKVKK